MVAKIRLEKTIPSCGRLIQAWVITDDSDTDHDIVTDSEWGDITATEGGDELISVCGVVATTTQIAELAIMYGWVVDDGGEMEINTGDIEDITG